MGHKQVFKLIPTEFISIVPYIHIYFSHNTGGFDGQYCSLPIGVTSDTKYNICTIQYVNNRILTLMCEKRKNIKKLHLLIFKGFTKISQMFHLYFCKLIWK